MSLHAEDSNGEVDVYEEVENVKKISNSTFTKKKRYVNVDFNNIIIYKFILTAIAYSGFFFHSFAVEYLSLKF